MNKISCNIIRDLLPLYVDEVVSQDTRAMMVEHLEQCAECREKYENMKSTVVIPVEGDIKLLEHFKNAWKKKKIFLVCSTVFLTIVIIFCAIAIFKQVQKQSLQYSQEYVVGHPGIKGHVDVQKYIDIHQDFDIGANKYGLPVFKNPERALSTFKELYSDAITLIQTEFYLDELTTESCQWYKIYGAQVQTGTQEERERANFVSRFLDIYENSFYEQ